MVKLENLGLALHYFSPSGEHELENQEREKRRYQYGYIEVDKIALRGVFLMKSQTKKDWFVSFFLFFFVWCAIPIYNFDKLDENYLFQGWGNGGNRVYIRRNPRLRTLQ